jgi:voltage-dependent calcium channel T type alpha-1G
VNASIETSVGRLIYLFFESLLLGQLFKGSFFYCEGPNIRSVRNRTDCLAADPRNMWVNRAYNFDDLGQALMALFVLSSKDGWVNIMYTGLDAVGVDQQVLSTQKEFENQN